MDDRKFEFIDGDILYGLDEPRDAMRQAILSTQKHSIGKIKFLGMTMRHKKMTRIIIQNQLTNSVINVPKHSENLYKPGNFYETSKSIHRNKEVQSDTERAIRFKQFLQQHPRWNIEKGINLSGSEGIHMNRLFPSGKVVDINPALLKKNMKLRKVPKKKDHISLDYSKQAWMRTSKAGLAFQLSEGKGRVHFLLDGIDYQRVVNKMPGDITSSELRWLYRHRQEPAVMSNVIFWLEGQRVMAPWETSEGQHIFASYIPKSSLNMQEDDSVMLELISYSTRL